MNVLNPSTFADIMVLGLQFAAALALSHGDAWTLLLVSLLSAGRLIFMRDRGDALVFILGMIFGSASDALQVAAGVYSYAHPGPGGLPGYMWVVWGQIMLVVRGLLATVDRANNTDWMFQKFDARFFLQSLPFGVATAAVCWLYSAPFVVIGVCLAMCALTVAGNWRTGDGFLMVLSGVLGPLAEGTLVHGGIYSFSVPIFWKMPAWHPFYWIASILFLRRLRGRLDAAPYYSRLSDGATSTSM